MFKKFLALSSAVFVAAAGFTAVAVSSASADTLVTNLGVGVLTPAAPGIAFSSVAGLGENPQWQVTSLSWYDSTTAVSATGSAFQVGHQYVATVQAAIDFGYTFTGLTTSSFTNTGATSVTATSLTATAATIRIVFPVVASVPVTDFSISVTAAPTYSMPASAINISDANNMSTQWSVSNLTWSPSVTGSFAASTVYTATFTATTYSPKSFDNLSTSAFTLTGAGATGATVSNTTTTTGATSTNITIVFPATGAGGGNNNNNNNNNVQMTSTATASNITNTSFTFDFSTLAAAHSAISNWDVQVRLAGTSPVLQTIHLTGGAHSTPITGLTAGMIYNVFVGDPAQPLVNGSEVGYEPGLIVTTTGGSSQQNSQQSSQQSTIDAAQVAAIAAAKAKAAAQSTLVTSFAANKPVKVTDFAAAGIPVASPTALTRVTADIANLPAAQRTDLAAIAKVVQTENFVDKVATPATHKAVTTVDLVQQGLVDPSNPNKASIVIALQKADPSTLTSLADIQAKIKAAMDAVAARKARTAAIIAKIEGRTATK